MTTPIKPPGQGLPPTSTSDVEGTAKSAGTAKTGESFQATLERTSQASKSANVGAPAAIGALVDDLKAGRITLDGALDKLVARAVGSGPAKALSAAQRTELESMLRNALAEDPHLVALTKDLERGQ